MKVLLLYFMFFVVSAFILMQCGKSFPTNDRAQAKRFLKITSSSEADYMDTTSLNAVDSIKTTSTIKRINPVYNYFLIPYRVAIEINGSLGLYNPSVFLKQYSYIY